MLLDSLVLAALTTLGCSLTFSRFPKEIKQFIIDHALWSDVGALFLTYWFLGGTITALIAGSMVSCFTSILLYIAQNEEDFMYLFDMRDAIKDQLDRVQKVLKTKGDTYRAKRLSAMQNVNVVQIEETVLVNG